MIIHFRVTPFVPICGADNRGGITSQDLAEVTCAPCLLAVDPPEVPSHNRKSVEDIAEARLDAFERSAENGPLAPHPDYFKVREMITLIRKLRRGSLPSDTP